MAKRAHEWADEFRRHPAKWAIAYRRINNLPWSFDGREYLIQPHEDMSRRICIQKGAQTGLTETGINRALHSCIALQRDVMYVLPGLRDVEDFSRTRLDTAITGSPRIRKKLGRLRGAYLKQLSKRNLYVRISKSPSQMRSVPVAALILDEFDLMDPANVALARKRLSGQEFAHVREINYSTPEIPGLGIHAEFNRSDQHRYFIPCPHCDAWDYMRWPDCFDLDTASWRCSVCRGTYSDAAKRKMVSRGEWRPLKPENALRGYHLTQFVSPVMTAARVIDEFRESNRDSHARQQWYNSILGEPHIEEAQRLTEETIRSLMVGPPMPQASTGMSAMGVDVGIPWCYWSVARWEPGGVRRDIAHGRTEGFSPLHAVIRTHDVRVCVIDANPERHQVRQFVRTSNCQVYACFYPEMRDYVRWDFENNEVSANRTETLDRYLARFHDGTIILPRDASDRFVRHHRALVRVTRKNKATGNLEARYRNAGDDHYAHAGNYCEIAGILCGTVTAPDIPADPSLQAEQAVFAACDDEDFGEYAEGLLDASTW